MGAGARLPVVRCDVHVRGHWRQGLTLVHFPAQPEPFLVAEAKATVHLSAQPETLLPLDDSRHSPQKVLASSRKVAARGPPEMLTLS